MTDGYRPWSKFNAHQWSKFNARGHLSYHMCKHISAISVHSLSPVTSSAQDDSTSELLRFL